jgi:hypothetical protein
MPTLYRRDEVVVDAMGNPLSGVQIGVASQPANTSSFRPSPALQIYADNAGADLYLYLHKRMRMDTPSITCPLAYIQFPSIRPRLPGRLWCSQTR